jgi:acyl dehydratase
VHVFTGVDEFAAAAGQELGSSDWLAIDQQRVNLFADATGDHQWIHVDPERAKDGPFGGTIGHGYMTLSLLPVLVQRIFRVDGLKMAINYGLNKVRFPAPVPVGAKVRATSRLADVMPIEGGLQFTLATAIEIEGSDKPACVAETIGRYFA